MTSIGILGGEGRMGRAIADAAGARSIGGAVNRGADEKALAALAAASDVLVDFTAPDALQAHLEAAVEAGKPIVIGTTGLAPEHHRAIDEAANRIAVLQTANTSLGVNLLRALVEQAARRLGPEWDIEIVEMHHRHKRDTPSGTALLLGASANIGRQTGSTTANNRFDRMQEGPHEREEGGIYYASLRGGSVAGDHLVIFAGEGERIELGHRAESRAIFAKGAVKAALWLADKPAGRYAMADVLGL
ncbi:MAG: 4-hydroxy-tetrahydrodipicolinate reductase [Alphaproteobacteria bacterium]|nr:MAG: 4-hydroxy-tetrahydrodipicolinate reductase [Alphaproteobacteria bacterium]